ETGTGKELAARAIHDHSSVSAGPFVPVCPASLNPTLIESELFGHVRGAFTGADEQRRGLFEMAAGGTLFLDEIADTPPAVQVKLLRVLESRRFSPVGSGTERSTTARFIAATHRNLPQLIAAGQFREDLYHRLTAFTIHLPPLRERHGDLPLLVNAFLAQLPDNVRPGLVSNKFLQALQQRPWTGNVRELRNAVEHAVVLCRGGQLLPEHLPRHALPENSHYKTGNTTDLSSALNRWIDLQLQEQPDNLYAQATRMLDSLLLREILSRTSQNRTAAAKILGMDRATLRNRLRELDPHCDPE
ncbi:MAG: sigma 54-interacting transcriptional regulator, partial [Planctomycetaceae bacterium]